jgi:hypothetical protein
LKLIELSRIEDVRSNYVPVPLHLVRKPMGMELETRNLVRHFEVIFEHID